ncbi:MAG TPA: hypothetical protein VG755_44670 [Nannocystaceae bacterium]|nr:hypothetical protein [Nannocystaceae bacterium]
MSKHHGHRLARLGLPILLAALPCIATAAPQSGAKPTTATKPGTTTTPTTKPGEPAIPPSEPIETEPTEIEPTEPTEPTEPPEPTEPEPQPEGTIDAGAAAALQQDARTLRDDLFKARARVSIVASKLFTTRIALQLRSNLERFYTVTDLTLRIDGAPVYVQERGLPSTDGDLFDVFAAPGSHELSVSADLVSRRDATYKLRIDHALTFAVDADARVSSKLQLRETGNMWRFAKKRRGYSDVRIRLKAQAKRTKKGKKS